jgi:hypothetical protein
MRPALLGALRHRGAEVLAHVVLGEVGVLPAQRDRRVVASEGQRESLS